MHADPIFFAPNRVWRCYTGGVLLDRFVGAEDGKDDHFPEDWLASVTRAINGEHSQGPDEGLARTLTPDGRPGPLFSQLIEQHAEAFLGGPHVAKHGKTAALLCKYLDSAVRLPIQCHPDKTIARRLYNSTYGKAESWTILDCRPIDGEQPYLLMGFKPGIDKRAFLQAVSDQDIPALVGMLHKIPAEVGKTYMVPGRLPHAIGPGVFMLEVQEPSDWVVQPERLCAGTTLSEKDMYGPLRTADALDVFDYAGLTLDELHARIDCGGRSISRAAGGEVRELIGSAETDAFGLWQVQIKGDLAVQLPRAFGVVVAARGEGQMKWPGGSRAIGRGQYFFQPAGLNNIAYSAPKGLTLILALPPRS